MDFAFLWEKLQNSVVQKNLSDQMRIFSIHDLCAFVGAVTQYSY